MDAKMSESLRRNGICVASKCLSPNNWLQRESSNFAVGNPGRHDFNQAIELNITDNGMTYLLIRCAKRVTSPLWYSSKNPCYLRKSKPQIMGHSTRYPPSTLQKLLRSWKMRKDGGNSHRPEETKGRWQGKACGTQDLVLEQKRDIGEIQVKSYSFSSNSGLQNSVSFDSCLMFGM